MDSPILTRITMILRVYKAYMTLDCMSKRQYDDIDVYDGLGFLLSPFVSVSYNNIIENVEFRLEMHKKSPVYLGMAI